MVSLKKSDSLITNVGYTQGEEFTHVTYTAATCEPEDFAASHFKLTTASRRVRIAVVVTMYNEDEALFIKTILAAQKNIAYLCSDKCPRSWGPEGWKQFVICIVADGRSKINKSVLSVLGVMGLYIDGLCRSSINSKPVTAHIFESTVQVAVDGDLEIRTRLQGIVPTQTIFILKEKNKKKINSHKWFFQAVCEALDPEVTILLDVGTKPAVSSFYHLYREFERNPNVAGACGEIAAELGACCSNLLNPLVAAQNFEYKMSNILDKPLESICGYISVLPGAFSAYRYNSLKGTPLQQYFKGEEATESMFTSNLYLAEDRILCFELVAKKDEAFILKYVKSAKAETDVPSTLPELVSQRRRWLNGTFFAGIYAFTHFRQVLKTRHSFAQKLLFAFEYLYIGVNLLFTWFNIGNFYLAFYFLLDTSDEGPFKQNGKYVFQAVREVYIFLIVTIFVTSLSNRPQGTKWLYYTISSIFALVMGLMLFFAGWSVYAAIANYQTWQTLNQASGASLSDYFKATPVFREMVVALLSTYCIYIVSSLMHLEPWHCVTSLVQYLFLVPTYLNVFNIYAFCNLHDLAWGTKGDNTVVTKDVGEKRKEDGSEKNAIISVAPPLTAEDAWKSHFAELQKLKGGQDTVKTKRDGKTKYEDSCKEFRTKVVLIWIICNAALVAVFTNQGLVDALFSFAQKQNPATYVNPYLTFLLWSVAGLGFVRCVGSTLFMLQWIVET